MSKPVVRLWNAWGLGIIILHPSGVLYSNQVGGYSCMQPEVEGVYIPLFDEVRGSGQENKLYKYFTGSKWGDYCANGIDVETADFIDSILAESYYTKYLTVNRDMLTTCYEAWIYVAISLEQKLEDSPLFWNFRGKQAILTWSNSD